MKREAMQAGDYHEQVGVPLGLGWTAVLEAKPRGAMLRLRHPHQHPMAIEIAMTPQGPVIRASAAALEIEAATDVVARCDRFMVDAREGIELRGATITQHATRELRIDAAAVEVEARTGAVVMHANDDVQLLGEQVLLNCERDAPLPSWIPRTPTAEVTVLREDMAGDLALLEHVGESSVE